MICGDTHFLPLHITQNRFSPPNPCPQGTPRYPTGLFSIVHAKISVFPCRTSQYLPGSYLHFVPGFIR